MAPSPPPPPHSINFFTDANFASVQRLLSQREERQRLGTSVSNDSTHTNKKAEALVKQADEMKLAGRQYYEQALTLYTQAIDLDSFNHIYFYHRAQLFLQCDMPLASMDAKFALELLMGSGDVMQTYRNNDIFCSIWLILVESEMKIGDLHHAHRYVQVALSIIPPHQPLRLCLLTFQRVIQERLNEIQWRITEVDTGDGANSTIPVRLQNVMDNGDDFMFVYTSQIRFSSPMVPVKKIQPELLAVDLPAEMLMNGDMESVFQHVISKKLKDITASVVASSSSSSSAASSSSSTTTTTSSMGRQGGGGEQKEQQQQQVMEAFQTPDSRYSITPILVVRKDDCQSLQRHLMCDCRDDCRIVVIKVDDNTKQSNKKNSNQAVAGNDRTNDGSSTVLKPLSEVQAKAYVATIVENAPTCQERYKKGIKLVMDQVIHELTKQMSNLISSSSGGGGGGGGSSSSTTDAPSKKSSHTK